MWVEFLYNFESEGPGHLEAVAKQDYIAYQIWNIKGDFGKNPDLVKPHAVRVRILKKKGKSNIFSILNTE